MPINSSVVGSQACSVSTKDAVPVTASIVVVDDDIVLNRSMRDTLERADYTVVTLFGGENILVTVETFAPDLIICDLVMPTVDRLAVIRELHLAACDVPILSISGGRRKIAGSTLETSLEYGANGFLEKPFGARELLGTVNAILESRDREMHSAG